MLVVRIWLCLALTLQPAVAMELIAPEQFLDKAAGRTLTFRMEPSGQLVGVEQFLSRVLSVWTRADGTCTYGVITVRDGQLCFVYDDDPDVSHCWYTFIDDDGLLVGMPSDMEVQRVTKITETPVGCRDVPLS